ncbi:uncharacterized protein RSE6_12436 [Rhynchosporium secalis]|uniref:Uncharacterized protein n=1 Tax=Rhynchosporium secalis TaxID=38038 RepID=A0A1E1MQH1_RHYSE|nr:uncharacterized protein RSE6_12436 [Rhynchosporium secalis]
MAVTYWRSQPPDSISYQNDGTTPEPSSTVRVRRRSRDAIPPGSVAARIKLLQSFKLPLPGESGALTSRRAREDSLSGYGRRLIQRFGNPAFQSAQPDQDTQVEDKHSYLGLNIARSKLEEEYDLSDSFTRYSRSPGISGQIDRRTDTRTRYDAVSLRGALSRMESLLPASLRDHSPDLDVLKEIDSPGNQSQHVSPISIFPSSAKKHNAGMFSGQIKTRRSRFSDPEATIATTSTMRRQNVRDIFDDFGIQRPAGLASREVSSVHHYHKPRKVTLEFPEEHDPVNTEKPLITGHESQSVQPHYSKVHHQHELDPNVKREHASEMLAQSRDPPKPPPLPQMVSNRKKEDIKSAKQFDESRKTKVEKIKEVTEPPPKEYTPSSQRTLAEHSTFEASAKPTNGISYMIPSSEYDHDQIHSRRSSSSPSRKHPVDGPNRIAEKTSSSSVEVLKHRLLSHREDQPNCTEQINLPRHSGVAEIAQKLRRTSNPQAECYPYAKRTSGISSRGGGRSKQKRIRKLKLKIVDWTPEGRKKAGEEHCLSDDDVVSEIESYKPGQRVTTAGAESDIDWADRSRVEPGSEYRLSVDEVVLDQMVRDSGRFHELRSESEHEPNLSVDIAAKKLERECERERESIHDCVWKMRFEELRRKTRDGDGDAGLGIMGVTVLVHLKGREDLIATAESWTGGQLKV